MKTMQRVSLVFGLFAVLAASHPAGAADVAKGGDVFAEECAECHSVREGKNKKGPSMFGVVGRKAAAVPDAVYSDALKGGGLTWTPDKLDAYLWVRHHRPEHLSGHGWPEARERLQADAIALGLTAEIGRLLG